MSLDKHVGAPYLSIETIIGLSNALLSLLTIESLARCNHSGKSTISNLDVVIEMTFGGGKGHFETVQTVINVNKSFELRY